MEQLKISVQTVPLGADSERSVTHPAVRQEGGGSRSSEEKRFRPQPPRWQIYAAAKVGEG
jgi:hypothetical protein